MDQTAKAPEATQEAVRRMLRMAEVTRLLGDMPGAAALTVAAEKLWQGARHGEAPKPARERQVLAA